MKITNCANLLMNDYGDFCFYPHHDSYCSYDSLSYDYCVLDYSDCASACFCDDDSNYCDGVCPFCSRVFII